MVRWGVLGLGRAANSFANAIKEVENAKLTSIASLSKNKNFKFGEKFNIPKNCQFNSYEELINCKEIDALYIATLNYKHADLIIKISDANKGILCEKPMTLMEYLLKYTIPKSVSGQYKIISEMTTFNINMRPAKLEDTVTCKYLI